MYERFPNEGAWAANRRQIIDSAKHESCKNCEKWAKQDPNADMYTYNQDTKQCIKLRALHRHGDVFTVITDPVLNAAGQVQSKPLSLITHDSEFAFNNEHHRVLFVEPKEDACGCRRKAAQVPGCRFVSYDSRTKECVGVSKSDSLANMTLGVRRGKLQTRKISGQQQQQLSTQPSASYPASATTPLMNPVMNPTVNPVALDAMTASSNPWFLQPPTNSTQHLVSPFGMHHLQPGLSNIATSCPNCPWANTAANTTTANPSLSFPNTQNPLFPQAPIRTKNEEEAYSFWMYLFAFFGFFLLLGLVYWIVKKIFRRSQQEDGGMDNMTGFGSLDQNPVEDEPNSVSRLDELLAETANRSTASTHNQFAPATFPDMTQRTRDRLGETRSERLSERLGGRKFEDESNVNPMYDPTFQYTNQL